MCSIAIRKPCCVSVQHINNETAYKESSAFTRSTWMGEKGIYLDTAVDVIAQGTKSM